MTPIRTRLRGARKALVALHIIASVGLLGATSSSLLLALSAAVSDDAQLAHSAYRMMSTQSLVFGIPLSFLSLGTGVALGAATKWGVTRYRWTTAKLVLLVLVIFNGALGIGPTTEARLNGDGSEWALVGIVGASVFMLATSVVLSVYKPGGRRRGLALGRRARAVA